MFKKKERGEEMSIELPEMTLDPLYHVTLGMGLPPPDSQTKRSSWPSLKGPMMELEMSLPSANDTLRYLGLAVKKKNYGVVNRRMIWWFDQFQCRDNCVKNDVLVKLLKLWKSASREDLLVSFKLQTFQFVLDLVVVALQTIAISAPPLKNRTLLQLFYQLRTW